MLQRLMRNKKHFLSNRMFTIKTDEKMEIISLEKMVKKIALNQDEKASAQNFCG